ncbi:MAG: LysR family transcriptional regulator [Microcoleus sp. PH2017_10_PVI_O_A]|uniref:LysR family transcriptional regulator n=1 Tax=unclassified Microcoleus TaxID=2642155 RepID=UPI001DF911F1|nr:MULTISPECIES: LysR family transcriptional regulator [unclassified Microcoleus]TAE83764.1 MAG: LysR family transcriptional regulator [Oscillatoriales cyanobacterium]MCC3405965.1 LysR family transcriptional regulator [Microcoleus sp. PH2017_10_PVI_O_A]MCC3459944.1 LysR family transcriptional regulator [Microcoleus sp. PH2017_11_PCY_U_A]MCC3478458.1 LysR family transcriptional regulator [Microcoleus sp. PH2017_12_PCY_D_A]MCC3559310.1 LysR family transcriptional regulator [Microcoleus sp. PH201
MINFEWYRSFIEVYRVGTVSGAAQVLHLTQPAVSQHVAALESALGNPLFQRTPRRMVPTEAGQRLYTQVAGAIEKLESVPHKNSTAETPQTIRIGTPPEYFTERMLDRLPQDDRTFYTVQFGLTSELIPQLKAGKLDIVIATQKITLSDIECQLLFEETFWLVGPPNLEVPIAEEISQTDLNAIAQWLLTQPWIAYSEELPIARRFWRVVFGKRIDVQPKLIIPDLRAIRQAVAAGFGLSVLPDYLCVDWLQENRLTLVLKPSPTVKNRLWLAFRKSERQLPKIKRMLEICKFQ